MFKLDFPMILRISTISLFSISCKSQLLLPSSDIEEIQKNKSILAAYTCDDLIEKSKDLTFPLKGLAGIRALGRCKDFKFDLTQLSEFEHKLYSNELRSLDATTENTNAPTPSISELKSKIKNEKVATQKLKLYRQLRHAQKRSFDRPAYLKTTYSIYKWALRNYNANKKSKEAITVLNEATLLATKTLWTENDSVKSFKIVNEAIGLLQNTNTSIAELLLLKGRILDESKKPTEAIAQYDLTIEDIKKHSPKNLSFSLDYPFWQKAWILYKEKTYTDAEKAFADLAGVTTDLSEKSRALFYQARSLKALGKEDEAKAILESIAQNDFFGYYGLVAYYELGKKFPSLKSIKQTNLLKYDLDLKFLKIPEKNIFTELLKFREITLAEKAAEIMPTTKEEQINLGLFLAKNNQFYMSLFRAFSKLNNEEKVDVFINYPDLIFPQPYEENVREMASKTNLPKSLIYSIMKQESAFNEKAHSAANAMGLMQVIPKLATRLSKKFEVPYKKSQDLYDPTINIQLGSFELMEQVKKQNGQLVYVAAAYNAGPGALANWLKNRKRENILEFIEEIPYDETRTYVKLIVRNKLFYERISDKDSEHDFPPNFLN